MAPSRLESRKQGPRLPGTWWRAPWLRRSRSNLRVESRFSLIDKARRRRTIRARQRAAQRRLRNSRLSLAVRERQGAGRFCPQKQSQSDRTTSLAIPDRDTSAQLVVIGVLFPARGLFFLKERTILNALQIT